MLPTFISAHRRVKPAHLGAGRSPLIRGWNVPKCPALINWADDEVNSGGRAANLLFFMMSLSSSLCLRDGFLLMSPVKQMLQRAGSPVVLMFRLFFNYLSIVEICIDKGLSGGDLCSCQLSPPTPPPNHPAPPRTPTGSIGMQKRGGLSRGSRWWSGSTGATERGGVFSRLRR